MKIPNYGFRYVAYDAANGEYEEFKTFEEAESWLKEGDGEGISEEAESGRNWIAEVQYVSEVTEIDNKSNYHENEDGELVNSDGDEWPISNEFDWIGDHHYVKIDWDKIEKTLTNIEDQNEQRHSNPH